VTEVLEALRKGPFREPAHIWLYEVRNKTGYGGDAERYADALVVSVFPSRGIWFAGIEKKVSRSDWLSELDQPEKSEAIQVFCDYWWVVAPKGIIKPEEVPEKWGFYEIDKKAKLVKKAPRLKAAAPTKDFVASVLRNKAQMLARLYENGRNAGFAEAQMRFGGDKFDELKHTTRAIEHESTELKRKLAWKEQELQNLKTTVAAFEHSAGMEANAIACSGHRANGVGAQWKATSLLVDIAPEHLAERFEAVATALRGLPKKGEL
jgi:hypothetical protein